MAKSRTNGGVYGLHGSAPQFLVAASVKYSSGTIVIVLPDGQMAANAASDIRFYLGKNELPNNVLEDEILFYPSSDLVPYSFAGFETEVWINRMTGLFRLSQGKAPRVITMGVDALTRKIIPRTAVMATGFSLSIGAELNRENLLERLTEAGYSRSPLVEDAGDFSVRGFIIDLYPPFYLYPVRIEQDGDRIESIRFFDPTNQRSLGDVPEIQVGPVHMLIPDPESRQTGLKRLREACDEVGVEKRVRQSLLDDFAHGIRFPGSEFYLPYFFPNMESVLDYLPSEATLVLPDHDTLSRALEEVEDDVFRGRQNAVEEGLPVPPAQALYLSREELYSRIRTFRTVTMAPLEIETPDEESYRIQSSSNEDIRPDLVRSRNFDTGMATLIKRLTTWRDDGNEVSLVSHTQGQAHRLLKLLEPYAMGMDFRGDCFDSSFLNSEAVPGIRLYVGPLSAGFRVPEIYKIVLTEEEIFGARVRAERRKRARGTLISSLTDLVEGEAVVHEDYGIGIFRGLARKEFDGISGEVMVIEYTGGDLLYQPLDRLHVIQKYISGSEEPPRIDRLGGRGWAKTKAKVKSSIKDMARELLEIYANRRTATRQPYSSPDETFAGFEASFEFEETPDQAKAIQDIMEAMDSNRPMDRLVCGDVGYGKTEVALRAAFRAIMDGKQVAVLVPTTVLAQQHYDTFKRRFNGYPIEVGVLSRFRTSAEQKDTLKKLSQGKLDLVIGTHKLLHKDVTFRELGLLVVDEEQRFGVTHKEKIKKYKSHVDVLTLTATPIPRTLNLALSGIRDLSVIETPPRNRYSITTRVMRNSDEVVREALVKELNRGGQAFYIHNRVQTIYKRAAALQRLVPEGRFGVAHGQMADRELEEIMTDFVTGQINILVCTNIVESGLDIPRSNTIIIERADTFGLADLYQLRGRVGRSNVRAYAYMLTPPETLITPDAIKRLSVIQEYSNLGQGFRIAMRDMEIRGAGNILGTSQSGHVAQVGYEMYLDLLEQAVNELKGEEVQPRIDPEIHLKLEANIPEEYVPDQHQRMSLYKRLSRASESAEIDEIEEEMVDLYGKNPYQVADLVQIMRIRLMMKKIRVLKLDYDGKELIFSFDPTTPISPTTLISWAGKDPAIRLIPGDRLAYRVGNLAPKSRIQKSFELATKLDKAVSA